MSRLQTCPWVVTTELFYSTPCFKCDYADDQYVSLDPAIIFGHQHSYSTRVPPHFANVVRCQLSFTKKKFRSSATSW